MSLITMIIIIAISVVIIISLISYYLFCSIFKPKKDNIKTAIKALKQQKGKFYFSYPDRIVFTYLSDSFTVKDLYKYYTKSRCRTVLRYWKKRQYITMDSKNIYHKTDIGKNQNITYTTYNI